MNLLLHQINPAASEETPLTPSFTHVLDVKLIVRQTVGPPP
jgi:hypothetical protein